MIEPPDVVKSLSRDGSDHRALLQSVDDDLHRMMLALSLARDRAGLDWCTAAETEEILLQCAGIHIPRQRILTRLRASKGLVLARKLQGKIRFRLLEKGREAVAGATVDPLLVEPENAFTARRKIQEILGGLVGVVRICDPYVDPTSLDYLSKVTPQSEIRLLTMVVNKKGEFLRDLHALNSERGPVFARQVSDRTIHDRYVIDDQKLYLLGTSLNGLGKKQSIVVEIGRDFRPIIFDAFDAAWRKATEV